MRTNSPDVTECAPTHQLGKLSNIPVSPNRYEIPVTGAGNNQKPTLPSRQKRKKPEKPTNDEIDKKKLFSHLPKISSKQYLEGSKIFMKTQKSQKKNKYKSRP